MLALRHTVGMRWFFCVGLGSLALAGCQERSEVPVHCSTAICLGGEVELTLAAAIPTAGEPGKVVLVEEGEHGTALIGVVGQGEGGRRLLGLAMVSLHELKGQEIAVPVGTELRFGQAQLWTIEDGKRTAIRSGEVRFTVDTRGRQLQASLRGATPGEHAEVSGRYRLECKVPESVLNVQQRGVNAPGSETYTGDAHLESDFCQKYRAFR
jgi:hypothetical protein